MAEAGLLFTCLGTGAPPASLRRAGPAHLVEAGGCTVLIDCGSMVSQRLLAAGKRAAAIDALIVTHLHSDHIVDFYQLVISSWHQGRDRPWRVIAPAPALAALRAQHAAYAEERALRIAFEKRPSALGLDVVFEELRPGLIAGLGPLAVEAFEVDHRPVTPAFGLAFSHGSARVVFSGDTKPCDSLAEHATDADLLVCEVVVAREMPPAPGVRSAETVAAVAGYHMDPEAIAALCRASGTKALALTHVVPPGADAGALVAQIRAAGYSGPAFVGEDLMSFELPARIMRWRELAAGF